MLSPQTWTDLTEDAALQHILGGGSICVSGQAGTGKSHFITNALRELEVCGRKVARTAKTHAASALINGRTLDSFMRSSVQKGFINVDVLWIDEYSLIDASQWCHLNTLCTIDTNTPPQHGDDNMLISIAILDKPIAQYRMPKRSATRNRSVPEPSIAVQHALIGVYDKLLHSPNVSCLLPTFTRIVCVVLSCSILLADSFTLVKIDDRYPDEWND